MAGQKCALIVDDSKTARQVLRKLLTAHQLRVETSESAEDALAYLSTARPDVIFMDHMMPGMDGFQAVRAIKDNPATATIPIMMYTSQAGELYVGQARALGAVGVLPKQIKPVEVTEILQSLHLIGADGVEAEREPEATGETTAPPGRRERTLADVSEKIEVADWSELHDWLTEMLHQHSETLKQDFETSMRRLLDEPGHNGAERRSNVQDRRQGPADRRLPQADGQTEPDDASAEQAAAVPGAVAAAEPRRAVSIAGVVGLGLLAAALLALQVDTRRELRDATTRNSELSAALEWQRTDRDRAGAGNDWTTAADSRDRYLDFLTAVEWTVNQAGRIEMGAVPLDDDRVDWLDGLVTQLRAIGFSGLVQIDTHVGEFCQVADGLGGFMLAPSDLAILDCERLGINADEALRLSTKQSVRFANYVAALQNDPRNLIRVEINAFGISAPLAAYPPGLAGVLAGDWNRVARENNRVQVALLPD